MDKAFTKGLKLIEALANSGEPRGITSLANELELTKSNVHRLLATLQTQGYVHRVGVNSAYGLTSKLWELGALVISRLELSQVAQEPMATLAATTGETVHLSILDGYEVIYINKIESLHAVRAYSRVGGRAPAWCVATGKALLAHAPAPALDGLVPHLSTFTPLTLTDPKALAREFERIRGQGYATNRGEWRADVCGIAAPVRDNSANVVAAIGISGPGVRLKPATLKAYAPEVVKAAGRSPPHLAIVWKSKMDSTTMHGSGPALPLNGVSVVEICNVAAGPFCGMLLADMGADVVKIESPSGDMLRQWPPHTEGFSENFASLNRGKLSIALDLKRDDDRAAARNLILESDVVLENNRPGAMDRLGLGYRAMARQRPSLIYCSISAFGQSGPRSGEGGFDVTMQAASGIMSVTGQPGGAPIKCGVPVADFTAGLYGAYAICAALVRVRAGGQGGHIDIPMLGTSLAIGALQTSEFFGTGTSPVPLGSAHPRNAPYQAYKAADRYFVIAAGNDKLWRGVCDMIGMPELAADPRFLTVAARAANQVSLADTLNRSFETREAAYWLEACAAAGVPASPINTYAEALADPQVTHAGWVVPLRLPSGAITRTFASPVHISGMALPIRKGPPALNADRDAILAAITADPGEPQPARETPS